jgi:hypothetical protein
MTQKLINKTHFSPVFKVQNNHPKLEIMNS